MYKLNINKAKLGKTLYQRDAKRSKFEVNPLDLNIAKIQYNLSRRLEREIPDNGDFASVTEEFISKDPTTELDSVKVVCKHVKDGSIKNDTRCLEVYCTNKAQTIKRNAQLCTGKKKDILDYLKGNDFFQICKKTAKQIK